MEEKKNIFVLFAYYGIEHHIKGAYSDLSQAIKVAEAPGWDKEIPSGGIEIFAVPLDSEFDVSSTPVKEALIPLLGVKEQVDSHCAIRVYKRIHLAARWSIVFDMRDSWQPY